MLLTVSNVATLFLSKSQSFFSNPYVVLSITTSYFLYLNTIPNLTQPENENEVFEIQYFQFANLFNTGLYKSLIFEILTTLVMPYPSLMGSTYVERANDFTHNVQFYTNDLMLCFMIFLRIHFLVRAAL